MIVPMKKASVIVQAKDAGPAVDGLRALGVVHIEHQQVPAGRDVGGLRDDIILADAAIAVLAGVRVPGEKTSGSPREQGDWRQAALHVIDLNRRRDQLGEYSITLKQLIASWERWGDFDPADIRRLSEKGIHVRLYEVPARELSKVPDGLVVRQLGKHKGGVLSAVISRELTAVPFPEVDLPKMSLAQMRSRLAENSRFMQEIKKQLDAYSRERARFAHTRSGLQAELIYKEALSGMGSSGTLVYARGYIPFDSVDRVTEAARCQGWAVLMQEPGPDDAVPTLLRNPAWMSLISPIFNLFEVVPEYRELDVSPVFLIFFSIFCGILIGDAGYGIVYFMLSVWLERKLGRKLDPRFFSLLYILCACTIIWGALTGTFFGQQWLLQAGLRPLLPALNDMKTMQAFCFLLGAVHLSTAHLWRLCIKLPSLEAISEAGWLCILWPAFFLAKSLILGDPFAPRLQWLLTAGILLVVLFSSPRKNIAASIGAGTGTLLLSLMNSFTDIVSYVRLFAIGLAGVSIADAFNAMSAGVGMSNIFAVGLGIVILVAGHALCLILGPVSILVHGVRLNVLEFSGHAGVTWSGRPYNPLKVLNA